VRLFPRPKLKSTFVLTVSTLPSNTGYVGHGWKEEGMMSVDTSFLRRSGY
jgi:hypothetical protein